MKKLFLLVILLILTGVGCKQRTIEGPYRTIQFEDEKHLIMTCPVTNTLNLTFRSSDCEFKLE